MINEWNANCIIHMYNLGTKPVKKSQEDVEECNCKSWLHT